MENINVGDIYYGTWGYSMIIPAFFRVTRKTAKRVEVVELEKEMYQSTDGGYFQQGYERPKEPYMARRNGDGPKLCKTDGAYVVVPIGYGTRVYARKWDGERVWADYMD